jgi:hypothetical protein
MFPQPFNNLSIQDKQNRAAGRPGGGRFKSEEFLHPQDVAKKTFFHHTASQPLLVHHIRPSNKHVNTQRYCTRKDIEKQAFSPTRR